MVGTGIDAKNAKVLASARTEKRGTCAILAAERAFAPMAVIGTGARNVKARVFACMAGVRMLAKNVALVALKSLLLLLQMQHQEERNRRTSLLHEVITHHHRTVVLFFSSFQTA
jgi:hypothetical protein